MNISRRWFLKSAVMAAVATQLPLLPEGHRVLFIDDKGLLVQNYVEADGVIRAKVVNGAWDLVLDTKKKLLYAYSNTAYGIDQDNTLRDAHGYDSLVEVTVSKHLGDVTEDLKPYTVMVPKYEEQQRLKFERGWPVLDEFGQGVMETVMVPVTEERSRTYRGRDGSELTWYWQDHVREAHTVDPLHGAGVNYEGVLEAAERKAGIKRPVYAPDIEDEEPTPSEASFICDLYEAA